MQNSIDYHGEQIDQTTEKKPWIVHQPAYVTDKEIVQGLRCCAKGLGHDDACENCKVGEIQNRREYIEFAAANVIERLTAENAALKKEIRKAGCMFCARFEDCPEGFKPTGQEDCDNCAKKPDCACMECSGIGSSSDRWEWRGVPKYGCSI